MAIDVDKIRNEYPNLIAWFVESFRENPGSCDVRARLLGFLNGDEELDTVFLSEHVTVFNAGIEFLRATKDLGSDATIIYRLGASAGQNGNGGVIKRPKSPVSAGVYV